MGRQNPRSTRPGVGERSLLPDRSARARPRGVLSPRTPGMMHLSDGIKHAALTSTCTEE